MKPASRILALRGGAIGDFIFTLPALQALREAWPEAQFEIAGYPHIAELAVAGGVANRVTSLHTARIARLYALKEPLDRELAFTLSGFDAIVSFLHDPDGSVGRNLEASGVRRILCVPSVNPSVHAADFLLAPVLTWLERPAARAVPRLRLSAATARPDLDRHTLALHPGSGSPAKNWPLAHFLAIAEARLRNGGRIAFSLGEADEAIAPEVRAFCARRACPLLENLPLPELAAALAACGGYVGNDTGITHLAAAVGIPTLALFGPSDVERWTPRGDRVRVVTAPDGCLDALRPETVEQELQVWMESEPLEQETTP